MATAETSEREYSPKAAGAAKGRLDRPSASRRHSRPHPTAPIPTHLPGTRPDRTVPGSPRDGTFAPRTSPNPQPTVATPPEYHRTSPEYAVRMTFLRSLAAPPDLRSVVATTNGPRHRPPVRHQLGVHVRRAVGDVRLGQQLVQLLVGGRPRLADQPEPRERRAEGPQGRLDGSPASPAGGART